MQKLYSCGVFCQGNPLALQRKVFFEIMLFFCRRGRENLRRLTKKCFVVKKDGNGDEYIEKVMDEMTKNHRENDEQENCDVIYLTKKNLSS